MEVDYCSFEAHIVGVKFYPGLKPKMQVLLAHELQNSYDKNSIMAKVCNSGTMLGHLDWQTATVIVLY